MTPICILLEHGEPLDDKLRILLFVLAQHMLERRFSYQDVTEINGAFTCIISTDFEVEKVQTTSGVVFHAHFNYHNGRTSDTSFLANYRQDWHEIIRKKATVTYRDEFGGDPERVQWN